MRINDILMELCAVVDDYLVGEQLYEDLVLSTLLQDDVFRG